MFMCANNHMYPVIDEERRETVFKTSSNIGGKINKYRTQQKVEHKMQNGTEHQIYIHHNDMSFYGLLEHVQTQQEEADAMYYEERDQGEISEDTRKAMGCYRIITTTRGLGNGLFYDQIIRLGNIHIGLIMLDTNNQ